MRFSRDGISRRGEREYVSPASLSPLCQKCTLAHATRDVGGRVHRFCRWIRGGSSGFSTRSRVGPGAPKKIREWRRRSGAVKRRRLNERKKMFTEAEGREREREVRLNLRYRPRAPCFLFLFECSTKVCGSLCYIAVWQSEREALGNEHHYRIFAFSKNIETLFTAKLGPFRLQMIKCRDVCNIDFVFFVQYRSR